MQNTNLKPLLRKVRQPARYINHEEGSVHKDLHKMELTCCFCFPDKYEIGMSNLGLEILYFLGNELPNVAVERCFAPERDMIAQLKEHKLPLFSLESQRSLQEFNVLGFSLQHELTYTNILLMLDLAGIALNKNDRKNTDPIVFVGGPCAFNPEPLADFVDIALIGEGEGLFELFLTELAKLNGKLMSKKAKIQHLLDLNLKGIYSLDERNVTNKHFVAKLNEQKYSHKAIIPYLETVHNRCTVEIMRGCMHGCRFCQAGFTWRPLRPKSKEVILHEIDEKLKNTGHDEVSLLSLSATDHPEIEDIVIALNEKYLARKINVSLPSVRTDTVSERLLTEIQKIRKSTITIAPEAGTQRLRDIIHKEMTEENIIKAATIAVNTGVRSLKLYFMIGLPGETDEDVLAIPALAEKILTSVGNPKNLNITISASNFVPKPHTPFQWAEVIDLEEIFRRQQLIKYNIKTRRINFRYHDAKSSLLECLISRSGREMGNIILAAYKEGCIFDAWQEEFKFDVWLQAFLDNGVDYKTLLKEIPITQTLPWDNIKTGVPRGYLEKEWLASAR